MHYGICGVIIKDAAFDGCVYGCVRVGELGAWQEVVPG